MKLSVNDRAAQWFKDEIGFTDGAGVRFIVKIYGDSPHIEGFQIAIESAIPDTPSVKTVNQGVMFFIEETDDWFFKDIELYVDFDEQQQEPKYVYLQDGEPLN